MRNKYKKFIIQLTIISLIAGLLAYVLDKVLPEGYITPALPYLFALFYVITALVHFVLLRITKLNPRKFVSYFMLSTFLKLMNYLIVIIVYVLYVRKGVLPFILAFFTLYVVYTTFEVVSILSQTKE